MGVHMTNLKNKTKNLEKYFSYRRSILQKINLNVVSMGVHKKDQKLKPSFLKKYSSMKDGFYIKLI